MIGFVGAPSLCQRCQELNLEEWFYPSPIVTAGQIIDSGPVELALEWPSTVANQEDCSFCFAIIRTLALDPRFKNIKDPSDVDFIEVRLVPNGSVRWKQPQVEKDWLLSPGWERTGRHLFRAIRYVDVLTMPTNVRTHLHKFPVGRLFPVCNSPGRDRLLHAVTGDMIDLDLIRKWMQVCDTHHSSCSHQDQNYPGIADADLRMIDVEENCIVKIRDPIQYFALSYCWGKPRQFSLTITNQKALYQKGALPHISLPDAVQDAVNVTQSLNCRYLWVDALCILQDDSQQKSVQINQMDKIYAHASVTIVAATEPDAY